MLTFQLTKAEANETLASALRAHVPDLSWSRARSLCATGRVLVDGVEALDAHQRVRGDERVEVDPEGRRRRKGVLDPADILHLDDDVVVVHKRAGVMTVPFEDGDRDTLVDQVRAFLLREARRGSPRAGARGGARDAARDIEVGVVQRLDKETTGVLVFARRHGAKRALDLQIRAHTAERRYVALVHGLAEDATYESAIVQDRGDGLRGSWGTHARHRGPPPSHAKESVTHVRVLERLEDTAHPASLVECRLETGRQHQIRIHLAEAGHPLIGERVYVRDFRGERIDAPRVMLHARVLAFVHPRTGAEVRFEVEPPADFRETLARLRAR